MQPERVTPGNTVENEPLSNPNVLSDFISRNKLKIPASVAAVAIAVSGCTGDPKENRTPIARMKTWCPNH